VQRLRKVKDLLAQALKDQHPESTKLRALAGFASEKAQAKAYDAASKALDMVWQLLGGTGTAASASPPEAGTAPAAQPATGPAAAAADEAAAPAAPISIVRLSKARVEWDGVRVHATSELQRLKSLLQREYEGDAVEAAAVAAAFRRLDQTIAAMNEELGDGLDEVLNAAQAERPRRAARVRQVLARLAALASNDPIFAHIDGNEFAPDMQVAAQLRAKLKDIAAALG
jgi:hypothetical protein